MSDYTRTPFLNLYKPTPDADNDTWGGHLNANADVLDSTLNGLVVGAGGPWLPTAGGTMTGPITGLAGPSINLTSTAFCLTGPNGLGISGNYQGSGFPAFQNTKRMIFVNSAPAAGDFCDFQFQRSTNFSGGAGSITACMRVIGNYGANDASQNWNFVSQAQANGSALTLGGFITAQRLTGSTAGVFGAVINGADNTGLPSSAGAAVLGLEIDCEVQAADDRTTNAAMFGGGGNRIGANIVAIRHNSAITAPPTEVSAGLWFSTTTNPPAGTADPYTRYLSAISFAVNTQAYQALDTRGAVVPTGFANPFAAVRMLHEQVIDFNGGTTLKSVAGNYLQYTTTGTPRLRYMVGATEQVSVNDAGTLSLSGPGVVLSVANGLQITSNYAATGNPAFLNTNRIILLRQTTGPTDYCDFQFNRTTTYTGGAGQFNASTRFNGVYGASDAAQNWNIVSQAQTHGTAGGATVAAFCTSERLSGATDPVWGGILVGTDSTGLPSTGMGGVLGAEIDCVAQAADNATNTAMFGGQGLRIGVDVVAVRRNTGTTAPATEVSHGVWFSTGQFSGGTGSDPYTNYLSAIGFSVNCQAYQALDTRGAIVPTGFGSPFAAVRMLHDQIIDFNGGVSLKSVAGNYLQYRTATGRLYYVVNGVDQWSVDASGNIRARGTVTGSTTP